MDISRLRAIVDAAMGYKDQTFGKRSYPHFETTFNPAVVRAMLDVCGAGRGAVDDWYNDDTYKALRRALAALDEALK